MGGALCWLTTTNGARCTMPEGHSGDCIAESARVGNIIEHRSTGRQRRLTGGALIPGRGGL